MCISAHPFSQSARGSHVTVRFGPELPHEKALEWVTTVPGKGWFTVLGLLGPLESWFDKSWRPGQVEVVNKTQSDQPLPSEFARRISLSVPTGARRLTK